MKSIHFATTNGGKVDSIGTFLGKYNIEIVQSKIDLPEPRTYDVTEVARRKAKYAYGELGEPCITQDSGFFIESLGGFPKTYINFALETIGIDGILTLVDGKDRKCEFVGCLAYIDGTEPKVFEFRESGHLADSPRGDMKDCYWSPLALIYIPYGMDRTLAEMSREEYHEYEDSTVTENYVLPLIEHLNAS